MIIKRFRNTKKRGAIEFLYYQEKKTYIGVCLTFNIIEESKHLDILKKSLGEAAMLHLKVVSKKNLSDDLLNRYAPEKYWRIYFELLDKIAKQKVINDKTKQKAAISSLAYPLFVNDRTNCLV